LGGEKKNTGLDTEIRKSVPPARNLEAQKGIPNLRGGGDQARKGEREGGGDQKKTILLVGSVNSEDHVKTASRGWAYSRKKN